MPLLIVATGARGSGKSHTLARLAAALPHALVIEEHAYGVSSSDHLYRWDQHIADPWRAVKDALVLEQHTAERLRGVKVILLASGTEDVDAKIALIQQARPSDVVFVRGVPTLPREALHSMRGA